MFTSPRAGRSQVIGEFIVGTVRGETPSEIVTIL